MHRPIWLQTFCGFVCRGKFYQITRFQIKLVIKFRLWFKDWTKAGKCRN
jgi:hypothetical protein